MWLRDILLITTMILLTGACSSPSSDAPELGRVHTPAWLADHGVEAETDLVVCTTCHSPDLKGSGNATSCFSCHDEGPPFRMHPLPFASPTAHGAVAITDLLSCRNCHGSEPNLFNGGVAADPESYNKPAGTCSASQCHPAAGAHPTNWQGTNEDSDPDYDASHRKATFVDATTRCILCHKIDGPGVGAVPAAPSCFSSQFTNQDGSTTGCHINGPGSTPHPFPFTSPTSHGVEAKDNMAECQTCHGVPNTIAFSDGIVPTSCATGPCHPAAEAHPTNWQGGFDPTTAYLSTHRTAKNQDKNCIICHDFIQGREAPNATAPSCFSAGFTNADGSTSVCHEGGAGTANHPLPFTRPQDHGTLAKNTMDQCQTCHGTPDTPLFSGGVASTSCATCHPASGAHPTRWQGRNDVTTSYLSTHRDATNPGTTCTICHDVTQGREAPKPSAPSCFSGSFTNADGTVTGCHPNGPGTTPHALPFSNPQDHGVVAKDTLAQCQVCHGTPGTTQFNGGIVASSCATSPCHPAAGAHPTRWQGSNDTSAGYLATHRNAKTQDANCIICHDFTEGRTAPDPRAPSCFATGFTNADGSTTSCHATGGGTPNHPMPFLAGQTHGPSAKANLTGCQTCHGTPDTILFSGGVASTSCATCHRSAGAHPTRWQGRNDITTNYISTHRNAGNLSSTCSICHDWTQGRQPPNSAAPSCFAGAFTNADGSSTGCHSGGP